MKTDEEILAHIPEARERDQFGFEWRELIVALSYEAALKNDFLAEGTTPGQWQAVTNEDLKEHALEYFAFAMEKARGHRGLSAIRSVGHYQAWLWLLGMDDGINWDNFSMYGAPILREVAKRLGPDTEQYWKDHVTDELENMANGEPCQEGCMEGCET